MKFVLDLEKQLNIEFDFANQIDDISASSDENPFVKKLAKMAS